MRLALILAVLLAGCVPMMQPTPTVAPVVTVEPTPSVIHVELTVKGDVCAAANATLNIPPQPKVEPTYHKCLGWAACLSADELAAVSTLKADDEQMRATCVEHGRKKRGR